MKTCPQCEKQHDFQTKLCQKCYHRQWIAKREPRQCSECGKMKKVFTTETLCNICYQRQRNTKTIGQCVDCGKVRRRPCNGRCVYCQHKHQRALKPHERCFQCGRMAPLFTKELCRPCYTNNTKRKSKYGITSDQYVAMVKDQRGLCAICDRPMKRHPHVDHDHATGVIRGLLCYTCNVGLGSFGDDPERLRAAAKYVESHRARKVA